MKNQIGLRLLLKEQKDLEKRIEDFDFDWQGNRRATDMLEEHVSEYSEDVIIFGMTYNAINILREVDSIAYRMILNEEVDNLLDDREDNEGILRSLFDDYDRLFDEKGDIENAISDRVDFAGREHDSKGRHPEYQHLLYCEIDESDRAPGQYAFTSQAYPGKVAYLTEDDLDTVDLDFEVLPYGYVYDETVKALFGIED